MNEMVYNVQMFALIIARVTAFMFQMPVLGGKYIPNSAKVGLGFALSLIIFPLVPKSPIPAEGPIMIDFMIFVLKEILVGVSVGLMVAIFILGIRFTGRLIGQNMGLMMANVVDPESGMNVSIVEQIIYLIFIFVFLTINGHYFLIKGIVDSYSLVPVGGFAFHRDTIVTLIRVLSQMFIIGFTIAMPVFGALLIATIMLGFIAKVAEKVKVMLISFPLKIGTGIFVLLLCFPIIIEVFINTFDELKVEIYTLMQTMY